MDTVNERKATFNVSLPRAECVPEGRLKTACVHGHHVRRPDGCVNSDRNNRILIAGAGSGFGHGRIKGLTIR